MRQRLALAKVSSSELNEQYSELKSAFSSLKAKQAVDLRHAATQRHRDLDKIDNLVGTTSVAVQALTT